ncbi:rod shape-determining protein MreC [Longibacter salinarum]|uniref:Cell shape-determining protein MreC n=2 Tax=Longibacter salinarum TaxID=1850348 RepID=A0A2A8D3C3_9BACT|nr:rod shape-determining protein MreC [Longibacter salinarum]
MATQNRPLVRAVRAETMEWTAKIESSFAWVGRYVRAVEENDALRRRNIELSSEVARSRAVRTQNQELRRMLSLRDTSQADMIPARIVTKDITRQRNWITLDVGSTDSVAAGMPVIHESGVIGKVVLVSEHFSRVMPFLNTDFRVPATIIPIGAEGIVRWEGDQLDRLLLQHVVKTEPVSTGQQVVTSGHSDIFPPGEQIGVIDSVAVRPGRNEFRIFLRPAVKLYRINHAFVIRSLPPKERQSLEAESIP